MVQIRLVLVLVLEAVWALKVPSGSQEVNRSKPQCLEGMQSCRCTYCARARAHTERYFHNWPHLTLSPPAEHLKLILAEELQTHSCSVWGRPITGRSQVLFPQQRHAGSTSSSTAADQWAGRSLYKRGVVAPRSNIQLPAGDVSQASETITTLLLGLWLPWPRFYHHNNTVKWMIRKIIWEKQQLRKCQELDQR